MSPLSSNPKLEKLSKIEFTKPESANIYKYSSKNQINQENQDLNIKHVTIEDPTPKFNDAFYETFSKNGNVQAPNQTFDKPTAKQVPSQPEIEISRLDDLSSSSDSDG